MLVVYVAQVKVKEVKEILVFVVYRELTTV